MQNKLNLTDTEALIIDIDGTLWRGGVPLPGLVNFFNFLRQRGLSFVIVTNNTVKTPAQYRQKLANLGVVVDLETVLTASVATAAFLKQNLEPGAAIFVIGETGLQEAIGQAGFVLRTDAGCPVAAVVVGGDRTLTYDKLKDAVLLIQEEARFIGANPDLLVPTEEGLIPEAGTTLAALQAATGVKPTVIGKPERFLIEIALTKLNSRPEQTAIVGDRLETDILGGQRAGLKTILVTSGVDNNQTIRQKGIEPDAVFSGLDALLAAWEEA